MAIKRFNDYETTKAYGDYQHLPKGGYVIKILGAELCENFNGQYLKLGCDIVEGEYADFFENEYRNQQSEDKKWHCNYLLSVPKDDGSERDAWVKRRFKTVIEALEASNPGYHFNWDEREFKGKLAGGLFNEREYEKSDKSIGRVTNLAQICAVEIIHKGKYQLPKDKLLQPNQRTSAKSDDFMKIPEGSKEELPFDFD